MTDSPLKYLQSLDSRGIRLDLGPVRRILARLKHPEKSYRVVLVAGTNGKGSISAMIAAILEEAGLTVGLYTSPHLIDFRERIRVNGRMISSKELAVLIDQVRDCLQEDLTYFEVATVLAFLHFRCKAVDVAVMEIGMGGRLDATNAAKPVLSVISNIALEHREYLGQTLEQITWEKAGIVRQGGCCLTGARHPKVIRAIEKICRDRHAVLYRVGKEIRTRRNQNRTFSYFGLERHFSDLVLSLRGPHQVQNAAVALGAAEILAACAGPIADQAFERGLKKTRWEGRLEVLQENPFLVVDGAHNPAAMAVLVKALREEFSYRRLIIIFGALWDKDIKAMLRTLAPLADRMLVSGIRSKRAWPPEALSQEASRFFPPNRLSWHKQAEEALEQALKQAGTGDLICVTGSLFLVGEIKKIFRRKG